MKEETLVLISKWLGEKAVYLLVLFFVMLGLLFSVATNQARELKTPTGRTPLPWMLAIIIHLFSFALMATVMAWAIEVLHWNTWLMCFWGGFMGMGANTLSNWLLAVWTNSETPVDFFTEIIRWIRAFLAVYNASKNNNDPPVPPVP